MSVLLSPITDRAGRRPQGAPAAAPGAPATDPCPDAAFRTLVIGLGAQRSGTSWLADLLRRHPELDPGRAGAPHSSGLSPAARDVARRTLDQTYRVVVDRFGDAVPGQWRS